ncbi:hypothetical protein BSY18_4180 (plasmid) [Blastomonas sp. RAC04]|nr:hypothetical protein BSY18_4180 [Blastomonas sp. RAC04]
MIRLAACHPLNPKLPAVRQRRSSDTMVALGRAKGRGAKRSAALFAVRRAPQRM